MKCFSVEEERVTKGLSIIPSPFPHIGIGMGAAGHDYTRIGVSTKLAMSLVVKPKQHEMWCRNSRLENGCPRAKTIAACSQACPDREMQRQMKDAEYADVMECCVIRTINGDYLIVESRRGDPRGLVHIKLHGSNIWNLSYLDAGSISPCASAAGDASVRFGDAALNFASGLVNSALPKHANAISILAVEKSCDDSPEKGDSSNEYLVVMQPGSAFLACQDGFSKQSQVAAYYDGQDVQTFCCLQLAGEKYTI